MTEQEMTSEDRDLGDEDMSMYPVGPNNPPTREELIESVHATEDATYSFKAYKHPEIDELSIEVCTNYPSVKMMVPYRMLKIVVQQVEEQLKKESNG